VLLTGRLGEDSGKGRLAGPTARAPHPVAGALGIDLHARPRIDPVIILLSHIPYRQLDASARQCADGTGPSHSFPVPGWRPLTHRPFRYHSFLVHGLSPTASNRVLLLEAALCLAVARLALAVLPFRWVMRVLSLRQGEDPAEHDASTVAQEQRVAWALERIRRRAPWSGRCLARALAGRHMLRRRGVACTLHLGVAKDGAAQIEAHAWLSSGDFVVAGGEDLGRFTLLATFS
jgi:hypothetical protein